jgi:hypothetical protein
MTFAAEVRLEKTETTTLETTGEERERTGGELGRFPNGDIC